MTPQSAAIALLLALAACEADHTPLASDPFTMHRPEAAEVYRAVADDVFNGFGEGAIYLDPRRAPLWPTERSSKTRDQLEPWALNALLSSHRFADTCTPSSEWTCPVLEHGVVVDVSGLFRGHGDSVIVQVGQGSINPPGDPHPLPGFGEIDWFYLLKESGQWRVVKIEGRMIT